MKYLVLKQLGFERKLKSNPDLTTIPKNNSQSDTVSRHFSSSHGKKTRRFRSAFTTEQIKYLEKEFKKFPYIGSGNRKEVSSILNIPERAVKIWFQNRRMKEKKDVTNKEVDEEQKKISMERQRQSNVKTFNQPYTVCHSLKRIYPDPSITKDCIKHFKCNNNLGTSIESKLILDKRRIMVKNFDNPHVTEPSNTRIVNKTPALSRNVNNEAFQPMKMLQNNLSITKLTHGLPVHQTLEHGKVKQENPKDLTSESQSYSQVIHPNLYHNPNQDQGYVPYVQTLPPPFIPGNILWKPVNVMPIPGTPQQVIPNSFSLMRDAFPKEDCKCNCNAYTAQEMPSLINVDGRLHLQPQYVLTMPFNHPTM